MKIRRPEYARQLAKRYAVTSALAASSFTLSLPAVAQPESTDLPPSDAPATEDDLAGESAAEAGAVEESAAASAEATVPAQTEATAPVVPETAANAQASASGSSSIDASTEAAASTAAREPESPLAFAAVEPPPLRLELLPSTAYPNDPITGIRGGSLGLVINRMQWPYMPKYAGPPALRVGFSGYGWADSNFRQTKAGLETEDDQSEYRMQGRFALRVTPVHNVDEDYFIQASTEFIANVDQNHSITNYVDIDDAWVRLGKWKTFDVQVGRMQGFEVYHFGMGLDLNTYERQGAVSFSKAPVQAYGVTDLWDRGLSTGGAALHWYVPEWLRLELLLRFGLSGQGSDIGMRPVGVLDLGWLKLKGGYERRLRPSLFDNSEARIETQGLGGSLQFVLDPWVEFGGGVGHRVEDAFEQDGAVRPAASHTTLTYGGFVNVRPYFEDWLVGLGYHRTDWENFNFDAFGERETSTHNQMFGAVQYLLWDKLYIKYVLAYAKGHIEERNDSDIDDTGFYNESLSHRLRLMVLY